ncbi:MAG TPA: GNAT family N-acetyltransferase [Pyrinomonadaceae bacterium]|nr:GNAT family N-acetyltransferase [Pyrinomonadaceae bacterium]
MLDRITYRSDLDGVAWPEMKATLADDSFDNGRTAEQLRVSFENSYATVIAYDGHRIIGTARALSDGVCNAYVVDVWTLSSYRKRGIARAMMEILNQKLEGQHVYLFSDDAVEFYEKLGFRQQPTGLGKVVGEWLRNDGPSRIE